MDSSRVINTYAADGTPAPRTAGASLQPFKYNGNEWIRAGGLDAYDFNARLYHPAAAQFSSQDPLAENYYATSPYAFCGGNPVRYSDPTGMAGEETPHAALPEFVVTPDYDDLYPVRYFSSDLTSGGWNQHGTQSTNYQHSDAPQGAFANNAAPESELERRRDMAIKTGTTSASVLSSTHEAAFAAAGMAKVAKPLGALGNFASILSVAYDFNNGTANTSTLIDAGVLAIGIGATLLFPGATIPIAIASATYGMVSFMFSDTINENFNYNAQINGGYRQLKNIITR